MVEQLLRPIYQQVFVDKLAQIAVGKISPNQITLFSGLVGIGVIPSLLLNLPWLAVGLLLLSGYLDTLDGTVARFGNQSSEFGSVLDIMMDRAVEASCILGLLLLDVPGRGLYCALMLISVLLCVTSFLVVGIFSENQSHKSFHYSEGLMERAEAFVFFVTMMLIPQTFIPLSLLFTGLVILTAIIRLYQFYQQSIEMKDR